MTPHPDDHPPEGYRPLPFAQGFMGHNGPVYVRSAESGPPRFGFRVRESHCNPMNVCHGGWIATAMDIVLPLTARFVVEEFAARYLLTVNISVDYLGGAPLGAWVDGDAVLLRRTGRLAFVQGMLTVEGEPIARGSGIFRIGPEGPRIDGVDA